MISNILVHRKNGLEASFILVLVMWQVAILGRAIALMNFPEVGGGLWAYRDVGAYSAWMCASFGPTLALTAGNLYFSLPTLSKEFLLKYRLALLSIFVVVIDLLQIIVFFSVLLEMNPARW